MNAFDLFVVGHQAVLAPLGVEEHIIAGEMRAVSRKHIAPLPNLGVCNIRKSRHVLFGQNFNPGCADLCSECNAILDGHLTQEHLFLKAVKTDTARNSGHDQTSDREGGDARRLASVRLTTSAVANPNTPAAIKAPCIDPA